MKSKTPEIIALEEGIKTREAEIKKMAQDLENAKRARQQSAAKGVEHVRVGNFSISFYANDVGSDWSGKFAPVMNLHQVGTPQALILHTEIQALKDLHKNLGIFIENWEKEDE